MSPRPSGPRAVLVDDTTGEPLYGVGSTFEGALAIPGAPTGFRPKAGSRWSAFSNPGANATASATKAAVAGRRNILTKIVAVLLGDAAVAPVAVRLSVLIRDGAVGAGTILANMGIALKGNIAEQASLVIPVGIVGSDNTALSVAFSGAGGLNTYQSLFIEGFELAAD